MSQKINPFAQSSSRFQTPDPVAPGRESARLKAWWERAFGRPRILGQRAPY
ncbi:MAG: hypothetical protein LBR11_09290 [Deltaproteobacteria bacterium]|nr:hypothetical protein [Deltaproteobacteria bacterium]